VRCLHRAALGCAAHYAGSVGTYTSKDEANAFMHERFKDNPIGVEYDPDDWLAQLRAGASPSDFLLRKMDLPVSPLRGAGFRGSVAVSAD
jgi:hypothetical protein